jgi:scavenger receptor class B, member 1
VILRNGSEMFDYWTKPPLDPIIKVYVFNYTNILKVLDGVDKLIKLEEVGPFVYRERIEKIELKIEGEKISFVVSMSE